MRRRDVIEAFALLGMAPAQIDARQHLRKGAAHDIIIDWWADCKSGEPSTKAVRRWVRDVSMFVNSGMDEDEMPLRGYPPNVAAALLRGALRFLPPDDADDVRVVESLKSVRLERR